MSTAISAHYAKEFLARNGELEAADLEILFANAMRYSDGAKEPIRGFGDDIEGLIESLRDPLKRLKDKVCEKVCDPNFKKASELLDRVGYFAKIATIVMKLIPNIDSFYLDSATEEISSLATLLLFGQEIQSAVNSYCECGNKK